MKNLVLLIILSTVLLGSLHAQEKMYITFDETFEEVKTILLQSEQEDVIKRKQAKLDKVLVGFLETDFMKKFKEMRLESTSLVATFKSYQGEFSPADVSRVKKAYARIADKYNLQLNEIKKDMLDRKKLKIIKKHPEMYSNALQNNLRELEEEYTQTLQKEISELTGSDTYALGPLSALFSILKFSIEFTDYLSQININARKVKEEHLNKYFIEPFRFEPWSKIQAAEGTTILKEHENTEEATYGLDPFGGKK